MKQKHTDSFNQKNPELNFSGNKNESRKYDKSKYMVQGNEDYRFNSYATPQDRNMGYNQMISEQVNEQLSVDNLLAPIILKTLTFLKKNKCEKRILQIEAELRNKLSELRQYRMNYESQMNREIKKAKDQVNKVLKLVYPNQQDSQRGYLTEIQ